MNTTEPPDIKHLIRTFLILLIIGFILSTPTQIYAKKVRIQPNIYQSEIKRVSKNKTNKILINAALKGQICYVGNYKDVATAMNNVNKTLGANFLLRKVINRSYSSNYYDKFYNAAIKSVTNNEISYKFQQKHWVYYVYGNEKYIKYYKDRKRYWTLAKQAVRKAGVRNGMSDKEAVKKISKWICKNTKYSQSSEDNSYRGALFSKHKGVCKDYSDAMWAMCKVCNIKCRIASGTGAGGPHAWNKVKIHGKWYWIDLTWMDGKKLNYKYYCKKRLWKNHKVKNEKVKSILFCTYKYIKWKN